MNDKATGFTNFAPGEHRKLIADIHRWARTNGWAWHEAWGWVNAPYASEATLGVEWEDNVLVIRAGQVLLRPTTYPIESVRQTVDFLVDLGILPYRFSSAYGRGVSDGYVNGYAAGRDDFMASQDVTR